MIQVFITVYFEMKKNLVGLLHADTFKVVETSNHR